MTTDDDGKVRREGEKKVKKKGKRKRERKNVQLPGNRT